MWYTDGSKTDLGIGAGDFGPRMKYSGPMGKLADIFQAEVYAIERCAQFDLDRRTKYWTQLYYPIVRPPFEHSAPMRLNRR